PRNRHHWRHPRNDHPISRRTVLKAGAAIAGALALGRRPLLAETRDAPEQPTLVVLWLNGGPAGLFNSADSFLSSGAFGVTADNVRHLGNGLCVDAGSLGALPGVALAHMASIDFRHGLYPHADARAAMLEPASRRRLRRKATSRWNTSPALTMHQGTFPPRSSTPSGAPTACLPVAPSLT